VIGASGGAAFAQTQSDQNIRQDYPGNLDFQRGDVTRAQQAKNPNNAPSADNQAATSQEYPGNLDFQRGDVTRAQQAKNPNNPPATGSDATRQEYPGNLDFQHGGPGPGDSNAK
jgi:hypothetical protein